MIVRKESEIPGSFYASDAYAGYLTTFSLIEQIRWAHSLSLSEVLYVGVGNGLVPAVLRARGISVTTVDINSDLKPDVLARVQDLSSALAGRTYQAVMACEVLEHIPREELETCLTQLASVCRSYAYLTLPVYQRFAFRFASVLKIGSKETPIGLWLGMKKRVLPIEHCWEIGSNKECSLAAIEKVIASSFSIDGSRRLKLNAYHQEFKLAKREPGSASVGG